MLLNGSMCFRGRDVLSCDSIASPKVCRLTFLWLTHLIIILSYSSQERIDIATRYPSLSPRRDPNIPQKQSFDSIFESEDSLTYEETTPRRRGLVPEGYCVSLSGLSFAALKVSLQTLSSRDPNLLCAAYELLQESLPLLLEVRRESMDEIHMHQRRLRIILLQVDEVWILCWSRCLSLNWLSLIIIIIIIINNDNNNNNK